MKGAIIWTPILREDGSRRGSAGVAADGGADDAASFSALPREKAADDGHPLAIPRVKQRPRRASSTSTTARRRASNTNRSSSAPATNGVEVGDDPLFAAFGDPSSRKMDAKVERRAGSVEDPLAELWLTPQKPPPAPGSPAGNGDGGVADSSAVQAPAEEEEALSDEEERDVKVAAAGLSDDPLSMMMHERAMAQNMARLGGIMHDDDDDLATRSPASTDAMSVLGGGLSSVGDPDAGGLAAAIASARGGDPSGGSGEEDSTGWGKKWAAHRRSMLREYDGAGGSSGADKAGGPAARAAPPTVATRAAARLEELEGTAEGAGGKGAKSDGGGGGGGGKKPKNVTGRGMAGGLLLTPDEYRWHVSGLKSELEGAWAKEEKVAALKVTVQAAKLLGDVSVPSFYPALFASIADLLEAFGVKVFERILSRAEESGEEPAPPAQGDKGEPPNHPLPGTAVPPGRNTLPRGWTCDDVGAVARETCRNWFYKTACIRELLPRILIEAALLPCYRFLANEDEFGQILGRLSTLVRGVGDPMVAVYCRCFVAAAGAKIAPRETAHAVASLQDYLFSLQEVQQGKLDLYLRTSRLGMTEYLHLQAPAVDWLLGIVGPGAPRAVFTTILTHYRNHCGGLEVLRLILEHFSPEHYAPFALEMAMLIKQGHGASTRCTAAEVMGLLGRKLGGREGVGGSVLPAGPDAIPLLNEAWQEIAPAPLDVYMEGAAAWLSVLLHCPAYGPDEVAILIENVTCRMEEASPLQLAAVQTRLADGVVSALACAEDPLALQAAGTHVVKILAALDKSRRSQACLDLLAAFLRALPEPAPAARSPLPPDSEKGAEKKTGGGGGGAGTGGYGAYRGEAELARALVGVAKLLHDSLDLLSSGERQRQSAVDLTCDMVDRVGRGWVRPPQPAEAGEAGDGGGAAADDGGGSGEASRLAVLAECRQAFWGMDEVTDRLVLAAVGLSVRAWRAGSHATARAALCFCSLTVPSVPSALRRLALLQLCANTALQVGKPALADTLFRSAICVVPECSPLVISGADSGLARSSSRGSGSIHYSPASPDVDRKSFGVSGGGVGGAIGGGSGAGLRDDGGWGPSPSMMTAAGGFGVGWRREHAGAWLLSDAVKGLLGALVAVPGHPDLGPFYLLRGLLKAVRSLPWPAGSGLLASIYTTAVGTLCIMWQERLPYSVGPAAIEGFNEEDGLVHDGDKRDSGNAAAAPADVAPVAAADVGVSASEGARSRDGDSGKIAAVPADGEDVAAVLPSSPPPATAEVGGGKEDDSAVDTARGEGQESSGGNRTDGENGSEGGAVVAEASGGERAGGDGEVAEGATASGHQAEDGAGPERNKSWLDVGGVLGTDDLYLRNPAFLEEVQQLLGDVMTATMRELEELWEQGEAEMASVVGDDQGRTARLRYGRVALDLANQLVANVRMEGGAASAVTFLVETAARAGARESAGSGRRGRSGAGAGGAAAPANYFDATVAFVSRVATDRLARLADEGEEESEEQEEACLTLLQGLSGFGAPTA